MTTLSSKSCNSFKFLTLCFLGLTSQRHSALISSDLEIISNSQAVSVLIQCYSISENLWTALNQLWPALKAKLLRAKKSALKIMKLFGYVIRIRWSDLHLQKITEIMPRISAFQKDTKNSYDQCWYAARTLKQQWSELKITKSLKLSCLGLICAGTSTRVFSLLPKCSGLALS